MNHLTNVPRSFRESPIINLDIFTCLHNNLRTMTTYDADRYQMIRLCNNLLKSEANAGQVAAQLAVADEAAWLDGRVSVVTALAQKAGVDNTGLAVDKGHLVDLLAAATMRLAGPTAAYAVLQNKADLETKVGFSESTFRELPDAQKDDRALLVHDEIAKVLTAESAVTALPRPLKAFNVTPELNASLSRLALAFSTVVDSPRQAQILTKTLNAAITAELSAASDRLTRVLDRLMILFQGNGTTLYEDWFNARVIQHAAPTPVVTPVPTPPVK